MAVYFPMAVIVAVLYSAAGAIPQPKRGNSQAYNSTFFWWPSANGSYIKAYLQGGPRVDPRVAETSVKFYHYYWYVSELFPLIRRDSDLNCK